MDKVPFTYATLSQVGSDVSDCFVGGAQ